MIFSCYRKDDAADPEMYVAATAAVLAGYPKVVIDYVADPRTGIASESKWLPSVAEIVAICERQFNKLTRDLEWGKRIEKQIADTEEWKAERTQRRLTYQELKVKYGDGKGGWVGLPWDKPRDTKEAHAVMSEAQKKAALESAAQVGKELTQLKLRPETLATLNPKGSEL